MKPFTLEPESVYVVGVGAQTPVGRKALIAGAAVRCGISAYREHPFMIDRLGEPMVVAMADWLDETIPVKERIIRMGADAALNAMAPLMRKPLQRALPVVFALSSRNLPTESDRILVAERIANELIKQGLRIQPHIVAEENAVGAEAIRLACNQVQEKGDGYSLVIGSDSHLGPEQLEAIDYADRLHSVNNTWGFTPGEAAGAILISSGSKIKDLVDAPLARIAAASTGTEDKLLGTKTVCIGEGLTKAFRGALSADQKVVHSYCDLNGETYRANEFGFAVCRTAKCFHDAASFTAAAQCWGDIGAASVPLQLILAASAWSRGYATGDTALCWASSATTPLRGAVRLYNNWLLPGLRT